MTTLARIAAIATLPLFPTALAQTFDGRDVIVVPGDSRPNLRQGARIAVVVGIDRYDHLSELRFADKDAADVEAALQAIGFTVSTMRRDTRHPPVRADSMRDEIRDLAARAEPQDTLLVYLSGHGFSDKPDGVPYFCAESTDPANLEATGLSLEVVRKDLAASKAKQKMLVVDACRNVPARSVEGRSLDLAGFQAADLGILFSTAPGLRSFEPRGAEVDRLGWPIHNGIFTHFLLRGLEGDADSNGDRWVSFREVAYYVGKEVKERTRLQQKPFLLWDGDASGDIVLGPVGRGRPREAASPAAAPQLARGDMKDVLAHVPATYSLLFYFDLPRLRSLRGSSAVVEREPSLVPVVRYMAHNTTVAIEGLFSAVKPETSSSLVVCKGNFDADDFLAFCRAEWSDVRKDDAGLIHVAGWKKAPTEQEKQMEMLFGTKIAKEPTMTCAWLGKDRLVLGSDATVADYLYTTEEQSILQDKAVVDMINGVDRAADLWCIAVISDWMRAQSRGDGSDMLDGMETVSAWLRLGMGERHVAGNLTGTFATEDAAEKVREMLATRLAGLQSKLEEGNLPSEEKAQGLEELIALAVAGINGARVLRSGAIVTVDVRGRR